MYNKTVHPLFASDSVKKKIGMGTCPFFHCSNEYYFKNVEAARTSRLRIEVSHRLESVQAER